ncbi:MAG: lanthionine synthetase, partial [Parvibaculaceae bacterium]
MLHDPERHETLIDARWDRAAAQACIEDIIRNAVQHYSPETLWPTHPQDAQSPDPQFNLYLGVEGVMWALT